MKMKDLKCSNDLLMFLWNLEKGKYCQKKRLQILMLNMVKTARLRVTLLKRLSLNENGDCRSV